MKPFDLRRCRVLDLSQNFSIDSPPFAFYEGPKITWVKKMAFEGVNAQQTKRLPCALRAYRVIKGSAPSVSVRPKYHSRKRYAAAWDIPLNATRPALSRLSRNHARKPTASTAPSHKGLLRERAITHRTKARSGARIRVSRRPTRPERC